MRVHNSGFDFAFLKCGSGIGQATVHVLYQDYWPQDYVMPMMPLGTPLQFTQVRQGLRGGMTLRVYLVRFEKQALRAWTYELPNAEIGAVPDRGCELTRNERFLRVNDYQLSCVYEH